MASIKVAILNLSKTLTDAEVAQAVPALQTQVSRDFAPVWGVDADLLFMPRGAEPSPDHWQLIVHDDSDHGPNLGYHMATINGQPLAKVFAAADAQSGTPWTITASHELLEMLGDPWVNRSVMVKSLDGTIVLYAQEVADPPEASAFAYPIDGVLVSDFVYPAWFEPVRPPGSARFDHQGHINAPLQILPGGYIGVLDATKGGDWTQRFATATGPHLQLARAAMTSRRLKIRHDQTKGGA